jgi:hypothetical protein
MTAAQVSARAFSNRTLEPAEARAYLDAPVTDAERDDVLALVRWFECRYPTPVERLAYVRRAYSRWQRTLGVGAPESGGPEPKAQSL